VFIFYIYIFLIFMIVGLMGEAVAMAEVFQVPWCIINFAKAQNIKYSLCPGASA